MLVKILVLVNSILLKTSPIFIYAVCDGIINRFLTSKCGKWSMSKIRTEDFLQKNTLRGEQRIYILITRTIMYNVYTYAKYTICQR